MANDNPMFPIVDTRKLNDVWNNGRVRNIVLINGKEAVWNGCEYRYLRKNGTEMGDRRVKW